MFECREHRKLYDKIESFLEHLEREHKDVFQKLLSWLAKNGYNEVKPPDGKEPFTEQAVQEKLEKSHLALYRREQK